MSYDTSRDTITVNDVTYNVERDESSTSMTQTLTLTLDGEPVFEGLRGELYNEEYIEDWMNPRADFDGLLGVMRVSWNNYSLGGGKHDDEMPDELSIECSYCEGSGSHPERFELLRRSRYGSELVGAGSEEAMESERDRMNNKPVDGTLYMVEPAECPKCDGTGERHVGPIEFFKQTEGARVVLPVYVYEHSGITMRAGSRLGGRPSYPFSDPWDSGIAGFVFDTTETREECGWNDKSDDEIEAEIQKEIEIYASYLEGDVTGYNVEDDETGFVEGCGGYVGEHEYTESECFSTMASAIEKRLAENVERAEMAARDIITN